MRQATVCYKRLAGILRRSSSGSRHEAQRLHAAERSRLTRGRKGTLGPNPTRGGDMSNWDKVEGEAKEQAGKLTDDDSTEKEGRVQEAGGDVKDKAEDAKDEVEERL
jgi:uncharacterized protein YjbJ (UPF0337 family)